MPNLPFMHSKQWLLAAGGILLTLSLFYFGRIRYREGAAAEGSQAVRDKPNAGATGMSFPTLLQLAGTTLKADEKKNVEALDARLAATGTPSDSVPVLFQLSRTWLNTGNFIVAGSYYEMQARITRQKAWWDTAAQVLSYGFHNTTDSLARIYGVNHTLTCYEMLRKMDPENIDYKIGYATTLIDGRDDVMTGVGLLREVDAVHPDNIQVNLILGRLNIRNGQYDKSIERLQKVITLDPDNLGAYLYLADCYSAMGRKDKAIVALQQARSVSHDEQMNAEIDKSIKELSN